MDTVLARQFIECLQAFGRFQRDLELEFGAETPAFLGHV
jgi:hypothetical protein